MLKKQFLLWLGRFKSRPNQTSLLLVPLFVWAFFLGWRAIFDIYSQPHLWQNTLAAIVVLLLYLIVIINSGSINEEKDQQDFNLGFVVVFSLLIISLAFLVNLYIFKLQIITPILVYTVLFFLSALWVKPKFWSASVVVYLLLIFTLPVLERLQRFIGFPLRLLTADLVSLMLKAMGVGGISNSTVIVTENYATSIDLPCSGVKSLYFGAIILILVFFLQKIRISWRSIFLSILFFLLLIFFNIWRVFSLVYIYGVMNQIEIGDQIHIALGLIGFVASCLFIWFGALYLNKKQTFSQPNQITSSTTGRSFWQLTYLKSFMFCALIFLTVGLITTFFKPLQPSDQIEKTNLSPQFIFGENPNRIELTSAEQTLFSDPDITLATKTKFNWHNHNFNLLLVGSRAAKAHHDPETCLQGQGYHFLSEQPLLLGDQGVEDNKIKKIVIQSDFGQQGIVYYWFIGRDQIITDYSEKIWTQVKQEDKDYILVELITDAQEELSQPEITTLFFQLNQAVRSFYF